MIKKYALCLSILLSLLAACDGCWKKWRNHAPKSLTIGITQEPDSLFIPFKEMMASEEIVRAGMYTLTAFDENWHLVPWAAKEIPTKENGLLEIFNEGGVQKMRTTWHLREDFFWPDGKALDALDFVFANTIYQDPTQEILDRTVVEQIEKMESKGKHNSTLVVTWKKPYAYYHNYRQHEALPRHILEPLYQQAPHELKKSVFGQAPALAGAFTIKEWVPGSHIIAGANPKAQGFLKPKFDEIVWRIIPQSNTLESNLISGAIDVISPTGLSLEQAMLFERRHKGQFDFYYTEGLVWEHIDFNLDNEILKDKGVRMALIHATDREGIVQSLFGGRQPVAHGTEPPKSPYFNDAIKKYGYDPAKARALLEEAGWKLLPGESIREKNGQPLKLVIMSTSGNKTRERIEQLLQSLWREVGVDLAIKNEPAKVFFGETLRKRKFDGLALYAWFKDPIKVSDTLWRCDNIPSVHNNFQGQNMPGWCNKQGDALLEAASRELDEKKRRLLGQHFEALFAEELPALPLFFRIDVSVTKKGLKNWKPTGMLQPVSWNAYEWSW